MLLVKALLLEHSFLLFGVKIKVLNYTVILAGNQIKPYANLRLPTIIKYIELLGILLKKQMGIVTPINLY